MTGNRHFLFMLIPKPQISQCVENETPGHGCSKLTKPLVNVSLKFQTLISYIRHYFLLKKLFSTKKFSVFGYKVVKLLTS